MAELENPTRSTSFQMGWWILFVITVMLTLWHAILLFSLPGEAAFIVTIALNIISAVILNIPYQRGEKWAWYTIWAMVIPYALVIFFTPELGYYLGIAILMALGQLMTWTAFFSRGEAGD